MKALLRRDFKVLFGCLLLTILQSPAVHHASSSFVCSSYTLKAYKNCVARNQPECHCCDPDPMDDEPEIVVPRPPETCSDVTAIFCPMVKCCSVCAKQAREWFQCAFEDFAEWHLGGQQDCSQKCLAYEFQDVVGTCHVYDFETKKKKQEDPESSKVDAASVMIELPKADIIQDEGDEGDDGEEIDKAAIDDSDEDCGYELSSYEACVFELESSCESCLFDRKTIPKKADLTLYPCANHDFACQLPKCCASCRPELDNLIGCTQQQQQQVSLQQQVTEKPAACRQTSCDAPHRPDEEETNAAAAVAVTAAQSSASRATTGCCTLAAVLLLLLA